MNEGIIIDIAQEALKTILILSAPMLGVSLVVGLAVSIFQSTTQIHEQTLTFVPKIIAIMVAIILFGSWMLNVATDYTINLYGSISSFIR